MKLITRVLSSLGWKEYPWDTDEIMGDVLNRIPISPEHYFSGISKWLPYSGVSGSVSSHGSSHSFPGIYDAIHTTTPDLVRQKVHCFYCSQFNWSDNLFCQFCGAPLDLW